VYLKDLVTIVRDIKLNGDEPNLILKAVYNISESQTKEEDATNLSKATAKTRRHWISWFYQSLSGWDS
jgi:hypothetical protein